eukprot:gene10381-442_t
MTLSWSNYEEKVRVCNICKSFVQFLPDVLMVYCSSFLTVVERDQLLRVCHRFQKLVYLPFPLLKTLREKFEYHDEDSLVYEKDSVKVYRANDRSSQQVRALKVIEKTRYFSQREWNLFQQETDLLFSVDHPNFIDLFE